MPPCRLALSCCAAFAACVVLSAQGNQPVTVPIPPGRGTISGTVIDAVTLKPLADAMVHLRPSGDYARWTPGITQDPTRRLTTDASGAFAFTNVGPIAYTVVASYRGYGDGAVGKTWPLGSPAAISPGPDETIDGLTIRLWPPATVTGRVLDERGKPVSGIQVTGIGIASPEGRAGSGYATTNEFGEYRMPVAVPGSLAVCVRSDFWNYPIPPLTDAQRRMSDPPPSATPNLHLMERSLISRDGRTLMNVTLIPPPIDRDGRAGAYLTTCAPAAMSMNEAMSVIAEAGVTRQAPDLTLQRQPVVRVSGMLLGPDGPLGHAMLHLMRPDGDRALGLFAASALTGPDGAFTFLMVAPGSYTWTMKVPNPPPTVTPSVSGFPTLYSPDYGTGDLDGYWSPEPLVVGTEDLANVVVTARRGVSVSGTVIFDDETPTAQAMRNVPIRLSQTLNGFDGPPAKWTAPGAFAFSPMQPGRYALRLNLDTRYFATRIESGGRDLIDAPIDVGPGGLTGLVIHVSARPTGLSGRVSDANFLPAREAVVVVFPVDRQKWTAYSSPAARVRYTTAVAGRYTLVGLPPGDYIATATDGSAMSRWPDPSWLATLAVTGQRVSIKIGEVQSVDLVAGTRK